MDEMFFKEEVITEILEKTNLIHLFTEETVDMKNFQFGIRANKGIRYANECPFCHGKAPAMMIDEQKYYCNCCGRGGNAIDFTMRIRNKDFREAVGILASKLKIETEIPPFMPKTVSRKNANLFNINQSAARFYFEKLRTEDGKVGLEYFNQREVSPNIRSSFGLGYADGTGSSLYLHLKSLGYSESTMLESGLVARSTMENPVHPMYDKFRNRVIFPILNADNKVIGFGGRRMGENGPKYLNSQETPVFDKGKNLYCYNMAKHSKLPYYICCEGYMDAMSLHQYGFDCAVASLGTALTRDQIRLLSTKEEILLAYDSDEAGIRAAKRAIILCREVGLKIRVIRMHGAKDPDEYLKNSE